MEVDDLLSKPPPNPHLPLPTELLYRELGLSPKHPKVSKQTTTRCGKKVISDTLAHTADYNLVACSRKLNRKSRFKLPSGARTTFHMAFSSDGRLVASCHGDHNVYVCDIASGKVVKTLSGHPRTPWCVVFHPTQSDVIASGCLAGHVRVWDLKGNSELLTTTTGTVVASLAFHPTVRLLAIGTSNEVLFWDWSKEQPLARCATSNPKEKVRLVRFDATGQSLLTGITNFPTAPQAHSHRPNILRQEEEGEEDGDEEERPDRFQESYRQLVNHYEDLVQHYHTFLRSRIPRLLEEDTADQQGQQREREQQQPGTSASTSSTATASRPTATSQSQSFSSIEALAQNILEMQNLCSQARQRVRLAPLTVETQHVVELQQIRHHLEVLQDQTRRLQSSIRATLTSLASGSLAVLANSPPLTPSSPTPVPSTSTQLPVNIPLSSATPTDPRSRQNVFRIFSGQGTSTVTRTARRVVSRDSDAPTRCLIDQRGSIMLEQWPTMETGMLTSHRSFPGVDVPRESVVVAAPPPDLRVFLTVRTDDVEMSENWQRNFLSGLALVPSAVREGRRSRSIRIRRNYMRNPTQLNQSFSRAFYTRVEGDVIPVYSSSVEESSTVSIRPNRNVYVFPITVFFNDFDTTQLVGIHWVATDEEQQALDNVRAGQPLTLSTSRRVRVSYDSNSLDIEVGGVRLGIVQPGVQILEQIVTGFGSGGMMRGVVWFEYLAPLLDQMERYFERVFRRGRRVTSAENVVSGSGRLDRIMMMRGDFERDRDRDRGRRVSQFDQQLIGHGGQEERVLSLAVETAASELMLRRPVESRIERVLNSGSTSASGSGGIGNNGSVERLDDIQRRISLLASWSRGREEAPPPTPQHWVIRRQRRFTNQPMQRSESGTSARTHPEVSSEVLVTSRPPTSTRSPHSHSTLPPPPPLSYYGMDAAASAFLSSRVQKWDFGRFIVPDLADRTTNLVVRECSLHSDACLDIAPSASFIAVLQPSESGAYSSLGLYSIKDADLGSCLHIFHFDQNTVSVSISPSSEFIVVGYAGRGPMYRFVQHGGSTGRNIGQILHLHPSTHHLQPIRDLYTTTTTTNNVLAINCMNFLPIPGQGIVYGTNTGELILLS